MTFSLIASNAGIGSTSIDSTGADLIVVWHSFDSAVTLTDSRNTLTALDEHFEANGGTKGRLFYYRGTNVGAAHTFTSSAGHGLVAVEAWAGSAASGTLVDQDGAGTPSGLVETLAPGSVTADQTNCLVVCGLQMGGNSVTSLALSSSFTIEEHVQGSSGVNYGGAIAHKVLSSAGTESPVWTWGNTRSAVSGLAVFLAADSSGGGSSNGAARHYYAQL